MTDEAFNTSEYQALRALFRDESHEALDRVTQILLRSDPDRIEPDALTELLRVMHSLKGTAGTVGLRAFADTAHDIEGMLERVRGGALPWSSALRDQLVEVTDGLRASADQDEPLAVPEVPAATARPRPGEPAHLRVDPSRVDRLMDSVGELVFDRTRIERRIAELRSALEQLSLLGAAFSASTDAAPAGTSLRALVDELTDKLGQLDQLAGVLSEDTAALRRTGHAVQDALTDMRMQSSRSLFQRLAPQVRALARAAGAPVRLVTLGGETEFDKSVADQIAPPLIHLLRNAVAHGIEAPEVRRARGKPIEGTITLSARHEGQSVIIEVADDGGGIDRAGLRQRLVDSGQWSDARARTADDVELLRALFEARLSSRDEADELAGRGIGLDAVRDTIVRLGGEISVSSSTGAGTSFTMRLPLTTALSNALLFKVGGNVYAIPNVHVLETSGLEASSPAMPSHLRVRNEAVPLVLLHDVLGAAVPPDARTVPAVVIDYASRRLAITCDKIVGPREIVVKSIGPLLSPLPLYVGGTISGSGKVQLILDPAALVRLAYPDAPSPAATPGRTPGRLLVADDSRAVREAMLLLLERSGYQVDLADDGMAAWRMLGRAHYDALVTDLEMPEMDGLELIERVRADPLLSALPIIVISSRATDPLRAHVMRLGVRAVLPKPVVPDRLLEALESG